MTRSQAESLGLNELARYDRAADTIQRLRQEWRLGTLTLIEGAYCSFLYATDEETILKYPLDPEEATTGVRCLLAFNGHGGVPILRHDEKTGAILMRRALPGTTLHREIKDDEEATRLMAKAIRKLRQAPLSDCNPVRSWHEVLRETEIDHPFILAAIEISDRLFETSPEPSLLHGDLHHYNLIRNGDEWWVIDPKGLVGDPAFESAAYLRNPLSFPSDPHLDAKLRRRIEVLAEELVDPIERVWGWGFAQNVVSFVWDRWDSRSGFLRFLEAMWSFKDSYWR